jgi:hypothetical protein
MVSDTATGRLSCVVLCAVSDTPEAVRESTPREGVVVPNASSVSDTA